MVIAKAPEILVEKTRLDRPSRSTMATGVKRIVKEYFNKTFKRVGLPGHPPVPCVNDYLIH